jgi:hypothetical protein
MNFGQTSSYLTATSLHGISYANGLERQHLDIHTFYIYIILYINVSDFNFLISFKNRVLLYRVFATKSRWKSQTFAFSNWDGIQWLDQQTIYCDRTGRSGNIKVFVLPYDCQFVQGAQCTFNTRYWLFNIFLQFMEEESEKYSFNIEKVKWRILA